MVSKGMNGLVCHNQGGKGSKRFFAGRQDLIEVSSEQKTKVGLWGTFIV